MGRGRRSSAGGRSVRCRSRSPRRAERAPSETGKAGRGLASPGHYTNARLGLKRMPSLDHARLRRWILLPAIALRVVLALVNTDANDNHLAVVEIIVAENRLPDLEEAFQAYHSKLYHATVALLWELAPTESRYVLVRV